MPRSISSRATFGIGVTENFTHATVFDEEPGSRHFRGFVWSKMLKLGFPVPSLQHQKAQIIKQQTDLKSKRPVPVAYYYAVLHPRFLAPLRQPHVSGRGS